MCQGQRPLLTLCSKETQDIVKTFGVEKFGSPLFFPDAGKKEEELGK